MRLGVTYKVFITQQLIKILSVQGIELKSDLSSGVNDLLKHKTKKELRSSAFVHWCELLPLYYRLSSIERTGMEEGALFKVCRLSRTPLASMD